jgi:hypothetical protein
MASSTLSAHAGGYKCTLTAVREVQAPDFTKSWAPIAHGDLIDMVKDRMKKLKYTIGKQEYALAKDGAQCFATFDLESEERKDFTLALGLRNSIDKSLSAGICCGSRVFVCDNLAFSSDIVFKHRHNANIIDVMPSIIDSALNKFSDDGKSQEKMFDKLKKIEVPIELAIDLIVEMGQEHKFLPMPQLHRVIKEFVSPRFPEFAKLDRSAWTLLNACTTFCKHDRRDIDPMKAQDNLLGIHKVITDKFALVN